MLRDQLLQLATGFEAYRRQLRVDKQHPIHRLLHKDLPESLKAITPNPEAFTFDGSDGLGNITAVPWVATFHRDVTISARTGYYVVWLFPEDRRSIILELGLGATQFSDLYGENKKALGAAGRAGAKVLNLVRPILPKLFSADLLARSAEGELPPLGTSYEHKAYGKAAVISVRYPIHALPSSAQIEADYVAFIHLYQRLVSSALTPTTDELVVDEVVDTSHAGTAAPAIQEVSEFTPRLRKSHTPSSEVRSTPPRRYSKASKKVGDIGEKLVLDHLRSELCRSGKNELADRVTWHQESLTERTPGWDITSYEASTGEPFFVEVKASQGATINEVILTPNEWEAAKRLGSRYHLYLVTNALHAKPKLEIVRNPANIVEQGRASITEASWAFRL